MSKDRDEDFPFDCTQRRSEEEIRGQLATTDNYDITPEMDQDGSSMHGPTHEI